MEGEDGESESEHAFGRATPAAAACSSCAAGALMNFLVGFVIVLFAVHASERTDTAALSPRPSARSIRRRQLGARRRRPGGRATTIHEHRRLPTCSCGADLDTSRWARSGSTTHEVTVRRDGEDGRRCRPSSSRRAVDGCERRQAHRHHLRGAAATPWHSRLNMSVRDRASTTRGSSGSSVGHARRRTGRRGSSFPVRSAWLEAMADDRAGTASDVVFAARGVHLDQPRRDEPAAAARRWTAAGSVFLIIEGIRRKPVPPRYEGYVHAAGLMLLLMLMVYVTGQDVLRIFMRSS